MATRGNPNIGKAGLATQIKPGEIRNPNGRPKSKPITDRYRKRLEQKLPDKDRKKLGLPEGATWGDGVVASQLIEAARKGSTQAAKEITDRVEGKTLPEVRDFSTITTGVKIETPTGPQELVLRVSYED